MLNTLLQYGGAARGIGARQVWAGAGKASGGVGRAGQVKRQWQVGQARGGSTTHNVGYLRVLVSQNVGPHCLQAGAGRQASETLTAGAAAGSRRLKLFLFACICIADTLFSQNSPGQQQIVETKVGVVLGPDREDQRPAKCRQQQRRCATRCRPHDWRSLSTSGAERRRLGATIGVPRGTGSGMRGVQEGPGSETLRCRIRQQLCEMEVIWATDVSMLRRAMHPVDSLSCR